MLKLRKVEITGFKSFCERTVVTFSGTGTTCIVGPNGCGKSNVVDAISWVLGEQSHKSLRAGRMSDCIFNGTVKRPPMGLAEVTITLEDPELAEAARIDGAGPLRFLRDVVVPLSRTNIAALFVILFIYGWNQYLWPLLVTTQEQMYTTVIGIKRMTLGGDAAVEWHLVMATAMLAMLPPALVVILMQKWFVKGLVETEK